MNEDYGDVKGVIYDFLFETFGEKYIKYFKVEVHNEYGGYCSIRISYRDIVIMARYFNDRPFNEPINMINLWLRKENNYVLRSFLIYMENGMNEMFHEMIDIMYIARKKIKEI